MIHIFDDEPQQGIPYAPLRFSRVPCSGEVVQTEFGKLLVDVVLHHPIGKEFDAEVWAKRVDEPHEK